MKIKIIIGLILISLYGCEERHIKISNLPVENIDFFSLIRKDINDIPDSCISNIKYINISTDSSNLLFSKIDKIRILEDKIFILDERLKMLGIFDTLGQAIGKVGQIGRAPNEYLDISDFTIDKDGRIILLDGRLDKMYIYDNKYNFLSSRKLPFEIDILSSLDDYSYLLSLSSWNQGLNKNDKLIKVDSTLTPLKTFCQYEEKIDHNYWISKYQFLNMNDYIIYNRFLDNHIYLFSKEGNPLKAIYFDFGKKNVTPEAKVDIEKNEVMYYHLCCLKNFTIVLENYLLGYIWEDRVDKIFLIDKKQGIVYIGKPDPFNKLGKVIGVSPAGIISCIYPGEYLKYDKNLKLPDKVKQHLKEEGVVLCLYSLN